jgi:transcriptional regulator with GAF, ATPase, and Fis domain
MSAPPERDQFLEHFLPGDTPAMERLRTTIALVNRRYKNPPHMGRSLLLVGESGVGKNHVARVIAGHLYWLRDRGCWNPPEAATSSKSLFEVTVEHFQEVSLPNVPTELVESELFGHVKGAFTGATADREGFFGTEVIHDLLLDEIGEAGSSLQAKLLQVLNDGTFRRVGARAAESTTTDARIFLATNRDLAKMVRADKFRKDLYWRIQNVVIRIPPLREQSDRIPVLAESLVSQIVRAHGGNLATFKLAPADLEWAKRQPWSGNVRELERLLWRWVYEEGGVSLERIQAEYPDENLEPSSEGVSLKPVIRNRLASALETGKPLADSAGAFARGIEQETQRILYELKSELSLQRRDLGVLFGDGDRAAKQISAWGEGVRSR